MRYLLLLFGIIVSAIPGVLSQAAHAKPAPTPPSPWWQVIVVCGAYLLLYVVPLSVACFALLHYKRMRRHVTQNHMERPNPVDFSAFRFWTRYPYKKHVDDSLRYVKDTLCFSPRLQLSTEQHSVLWADVILRPELTKKVYQFLAAYPLLMLFCLAPTLGILLGTRVVAIGYYFFPVWNIPGIALVIITIVVCTGQLRPAFSRQLVDSICVVTTLGSFTLDVEEPSFLRDLVDFEKIKTDSAVFDTVKKCVTVKDEFDNEITICSDLMHMQACADAINIALAQRDKARLVSVDLIIECLNRHPVQLPELAVERILHYLPELNEVWTKKKREGRLHNGKTEIRNAQGEIIWRFDTHVEYAVDSPSMLVYNTEKASLKHVDDAFDVTDITLMSPGETSSFAPFPASPALLKSTPKQAALDLARIRSPSFFRHNNDVNSPAPSSSLRSIGNSSPFRSTTRLIASPSGNSARLRSPSTRSPLSRYDKEMISTPDALSSGSAMR